MGHGEDLGWGIWLSPTSKGILRRRRTAAPYFTNKVLSLTHRLVDGLSSREQSAQRWNLLQLRAEILRSPYGLPQDDIPGKVAGGRSTKFSWQSTQDDILPGARRIWRRAVHEPPLQMMIGLEGVPYEGLSPLTFPLRNTTINTT